MKAVSSGISQTRPKIPAAIPWFQQEAVVDWCCLWMSAEVNVTIVYQLRAGGNAAGPDNRRRIGEVPPSCHSWSLVAANAVYSTMPFFHQGG